MKTANYVIGLVLIVLGALLLTQNIFKLDFISLVHLWPLIILGIGLAFELSYFSNTKMPGLLVPGGIFLTLGLVFSFEVLTNWRFSAYTWPLYPISVAIGLLQLYLFNGKNRGVLLPVFILTGVAGFAWFIMLFSGIISFIGFTSLIALVFIILGLFLMFRYN